MSIKEAAEKMQAKSRKICKYKNIYDSLNKEDKRSLDELFVRGIPNAVISKILKLEGYAVSDHVISDHNKGVCVCPKA